MPNNLFTMMEQPTKITITLAIALHVCDSREYSSLVHCALITESFVEQTPRHFLLQCGNLCHGHLLDTAIRNVYNGVRVFHSTLGWGPKMTSKDRTINVRQSEPSIKGCPAGRTVFKTSMAFSNPKISFPTGLPLLSTYNQWPITSISTLKYAL